MKQWEVAQQYAYDKAALGESFTAIEMAADLGISVRQATDLIQAHLRAQRGPRAMTMFVLNRTGLTRAAVWHVGNRSDEIARQTVDDMKVKVRRSLTPDLNRVADLDPQQAPFATAANIAFEANLNMLAAALSAPPAVTSSP